MSEAQKERGTVPELIVMTVLDVRPSDLRDFRTEVMIAEKSYQAGYNQASAENAALSERLRECERLHDHWVFALERRGIMSCDPATETYFNGKDSQMQDCIEALAAILSKTPKKDNA